MVTVTGLGSFREVGRSAILVRAQDTFLMDYGLSVQDMSIPIQPPTNLTAVLLSHAHLDHIGIVPELYKRGYTGNVYGTRATLELAHLMLEDALKVQEKRGVQSFFTTHDIDAMETKERSVRFQKPRTLRNSQVTFFDAGHVPGSSSILLETGGKRILYTGDIKFIDTELMGKAYTDFTDIDLLICESTYGMKDHPDRNELRKELIAHVLDVYNRNGNVVIPCFSIGRTQELLQLLSDLDIPIHVDGMGQKATNIAIRYPESVRNVKKLRKAFGKARKIKNQGERFRAIKKPGIIITTSGMLQGGPSHFYLQKLHKREECSLYLSGFQAPGTPGRTLQETGRYVNENLDVQPKMEILFRDWSAHCGRTGILNFIKKIKPKKTIFNHGDSCESFASEVTKMGFPAFAPKNGETFTV